jgi:hypothetical protein
MPLYENERNAVNRIRVAKEHGEAVVFGTEAVVARIVETLAAECRRKKRRITAAFEGWYAVDWRTITELFTKACPAAGLELEMRDMVSALKTPAQIAEYKRPFSRPEDPSFGWANSSGKLSDIVDPVKLGSLKADLAKAREGKKSGPGALVVYGSGAAVPELDGSYDLTFYFDTTKESVLWTMWDGNLVPFGATEAAKRYFWKDYYYCDFYLLNEQKHHAFRTMDFWLQAVEAKDLALVPRASFDVILSTLVRYPTKNVKYAQPGPWGAYRFKDTRWDIPGLSCNAWNSLVAPQELALLVDVGRERTLKMPGENLLQYPVEFVGPHIHETYPRLVPLYVWVDDGYFPEPTPPERRCMPVHNHPSTDYVRRLFNEPLGRYETYYIAEAFEGATTMMGFRDDANLEEWEAKCRESDRSRQPIPDWQRYIKFWDTNVGDLFLIPPGTTHGHGGNQMVIEMDTVPSVAGTEYSFFGYDFMRPTWDDKTKTMTAKPMRMHLDHYFAHDQGRRESWVKDNLRARPLVVKWTRDYWLDRYTTLPMMPFEIERLNFVKRAAYDTEGRFLHLVALATGERVRIRSKSNPELETEIEWFQSAAIPACFGAYEVENLRDGFCTLVLIRWKKG